MFKYLYSAFFLFGVASPALSQTIELDSELDLSEGFVEYDYIAGVKLENDLSEGGVGSKLCRATTDLFDIIDGIEYYVGSVSIERQCGRSNTGFYGARPDKRSNTQYAFSQLGQYRMSLQLQEILSDLMANLCRSNASIARGLNEAFENAEEQGVFGESLEGLSGQFPWRQLEFSIEGGVYGLAGAAAYGVAVNSQTGEYFVYASLGGGVGVGGSAGVSFVVSESPPGGVSIDLSARRSIGGVSETDFIALMSEDDVSGSMGLSASLGRSAVAVAKGTASKRCGTVDI